MSLNSKELKQIADLAYLNPQDPKQLEKELNEIMDFIEALTKTETSSIKPLSHPLELHQPLREDEVTEEACQDQLEALAPLFEEGYYWVPKVLETDL